MFMLAWGSPAYRIRCDGALSGASGLPFRKPFKGGAGPAWPGACFHANTL